MDAGLATIIIILGIALIIGVTIYKCSKIEYASKIRLKELDLEIIRENNKK